MGDLEKKWYQSKWIVALLILSVLTIISVFLIMKFMALDTISDKMIAATAITAVSLVSVLAFSLYIEYKNIKLYSAKRSVEHVNTMRGLEKDNYSYTLNKMSEAAGENGRRKFQDGYAERDVLADEEVELAYQLGKAEGVQEASARSEAARREESRRAEEERLNELYRSQRNVDY